VLQITIKGAIGFFVAEMLGSRLQIVEDFKQEQQRTINGRGVNAPPLASMNPSSSTQMQLNGPR